MGRDEQQGHAGEPGAQASAPRLPWWANTRIRLPLLLACLALAVGGLLAHGQHLLSASADNSPSGATGSDGTVTSPAAARAIASAALCVPTTPPLASVPLSEIEQLRASVRAVMAPLARSRYAWGTVTLEDAWLDDAPRSLRTSRLADGLWPASYEMRSWAENPRLATPGDDVVADAFRFAGTRQAQRFFTQASDVSCHRRGGAWSPLWPPRARDLIWINPDAAVEEDVLLLRGHDVFRIGVVTPQSSSRLPERSDTRAGVATANTLACRLPDADCRLESTGGSARQARTGSPSGHVHSSSSVSSSE